MGSSDVVVRVLDGEDTIGGSKILVGWGGEGVFLDFGINYGKFGRYFEEYLKPRVSYGLADLWKLDLIPRATNLYRPDVVPPGLMNGSDLPVTKVSSVYVSHAHLDHAGLIGLMNREIPMVASRMSAAILKAMQDYSPSNIFQQSVYSSPMKEDVVANQTVFRSDDKKPFAGRDLFLTDGNGSDGFNRFWAEAPSRPHLSKSKSPPRELHAGAVRMLQPSDGGPHARFNVVDHSVLGAVGYTIETPQGPLVYSGDIRATGIHAAESRAFLNSLARRRPWILLMEGTQVRAVPKEGDGFASPTTEADVAANSLAVTERYAGKLVIADFGPRNIERLLAFLDIARKTKRRLVIVPKDAYLLHAMNTADPTVPVPSDEMLVLDPPASTEPSGWEKFVLHEYEKHVIHIEEVRRRQAEIILCFSFWDIKHLLDIVPDGGCYIYSSSEAHSEEAEIDMERLYNWITFFGLDVVGFHMEPFEGGKRRKMRMVGEKGFHASGHMSGPEILEWVERIAPEHLIPIHTEANATFRQRFEGTGIKILSRSFG
ncbi:MAG: ribonuclease J [Euryarchaeota archaeon]|nr:ribonuclease J [Euryarchaeota archaeon]